MKNKTQKIIASIQVLAALILVGATRIWAPVCQHMVELANGNQMPMRCHYADRASMVLAGLIILTALLTWTAQHEQKKFYVQNLVQGVLLFFIYTSIIGICKNPEMPCHVTALWGKGAAIVTPLASVVGLFSGQKGQLPS